MVAMYNVVRTQELRATGLSSPTIRGALGCCLLKLSYGVYSVVRRCPDARHSRIRSFGTDTDWIHINEKLRSRGHPYDYDYAALLYKLRTSSYPHYRVDDTLIGLTAAVLHDLPLYRPPLDRVFVANPASHSSGPLVRRSVQEIPAEDTVCVGKMRLTTAPRAALELVSQIGDARAFPAIENAVRLLVFGSAAAADEAARRGYPADTDARAHAAIETVMRPIAERLPKARKRSLQLLDSAGAKSESYAESRCRLDLVMLRVIGFEPQVDIFDGSRWIARVDFLHPETGTILLVDGTSKYVQHGFALMRKESAQHNALVSLGYSVLRFGFADTISLERFATILFNQAPELRKFIRR